MLFCFFLLLCIFLAPTQQAFALSPKDILIVYNANFPDSKDVARYYAEKRKTPPSNLIEIQAPVDETISRSDFESMVASPIRKAVVSKKEKEGKTPAVLLVYGVPLRIEKKTAGSEDTYKKLVAGKIAEYRALVSELNTELDGLTGANENDNGAKAASLLIRLRGLAPIAQRVVKNSKKKEENLSVLRNDNLLKWTAVLNRQLLEIPFRGIPAEEAQKIAAVIRMLNGLTGELNFWKEQEKLYKEGMDSASVDSELTMLLSGSYQNLKWLRNPFLRIYDKLPGIQRIRENRIMVGRLDGATPDLAKRLVDDAMAVEKKGLDGTFYIDARGLDGKDSYALYDHHLRNLHRILKEHSSMPVVLDNRPSLFPENTAADAALYVGWYSLGKYVNSFQWKRGAVGFHIASAEAKTLKQPWSRVWCKRMIEEGVAAILGPVYEPYLSSFPLPEVFFPLLMSGKFSLLEVYFQSTPFLSWRQVLIGDPLYTPFKNKPAMDLEKVRRKSGQ